MNWDRENLLGIKFDAHWKWLLLPGIVILWAGYMFPSPGNGIGSGRRVRSPLVTIGYSVGFYALMFLFLVRLTVL